MEETYSEQVNLGAFTRTIGEPAAERVLNAEMTRAFAKLLRDIEQGNVTRMRYPKPDAD